MASRCLVRLTLLAALAVAPVAQAAPAADTAANRLAAAERLFDLPAYRVIATRQLYQALDTLPADQHKRALAALSDPAVMASLRGVISRSMAQTFTVAEIGHLADFLKADEARSMVDKSQGLQSALTREMLSAFATDPALMRILLGK